MPALLRLALSNPRASKKQGGSTKNKADSHPKYLGAKMSDGQIAFPGQIIVRQRGLRFKPGEGVGVVSSIAGLVIPRVLPHLKHAHTLQLIACRQQLACCSGVESAVCCCFECHVEQTLCSGHPTVDHALGSLKRRMLARR